nr:hypothetical protein [uncultured Ruegeria sp.]
MGQLQPEPPLDLGTALTQFEAEIGQPVSPEGNQVLFCSALSLT